MIGLESYYPVSTLLTKAIIKMKIHSVVAEITNSSTVLYTYIDERSLEDFRGIINQILSDSGSDKSFDDVYKAHIELDSDWKENSWSSLDSKEAHQTVVVEKDGEAVNLFSRMLGLADYDSEYDG